MKEEHNGFYYFQPPENTAGNWLNRYDYYDGKLFVRKDNSDTESGFIIERSLISAEGFEEIARVAPETTTYFDPDLDVGKTYYYRIRRNGFDVNDYTSATKINIR